MKRLFLKECIENRLIPLWCALLFALLTGAFSLTGVMSEPHGAGVIFRLEILFACWLAAGILTGAGLISREVGGETLSFLMSLPVSRRKVWFTKLSAGLFLLCVSIAVTTV
ncbi:MAG: ABC transporter permease, partial [Armatimonadota bacterium]|nr:ABC transporter permease [Armatimonadota bacterium]